MGWYCLLYTSTPFKPPVLEQHGVSLHTGTVIAETVVTHKLRKTSAAVSYTHLDVYKRQQEDDFNDIRSEYSGMLQSQLTKGNNGLILGTPGSGKSFSGLEKLLRGKRNKDRCAGSGHAAVCSSFKSKWNSSM